MDGLKTKLDRFGRVVLPKRLRDRLGLRAGSILQVEGRDQGIFLKPPPEMPVAVKNGVLVYVGSAGGDLNPAVKEFREGRLAREISRLQK